MMRKKFLQTLLYIFVFLFAFSFAFPAYAHGGEPRLEISLERINPGGVIEVRGVEFDYDEPVVLTLMRSQIQISLMDVTADGEGVFTQIIVLPADLPVGEYNFRAKSDHHLVMSPTITVWGVALPDQEDNGIRDQSDVKLGAIPTFVPTAISENISQPASPSTTQSTPTSNGISTWVMALSLLVVGFLILLGSSFARKR
jgi:hypothetical protein